MKYEKIITHPGVFHLDDAMAVALLRAILGDLPVVRRCPTAEEWADPSVVLVDVGGQLAPELGNYDHHQRGGAGVFRDPAEGYGVEGLEVPFAAAGLIWHLFPQVLECRGLTEAQQAQFHRKVDSELFLGIDAGDCGYIPITSLVLGMSIDTPYGHIDVHDPAAGASVEAGEWAVPVSVPAPTRCMALNRAISLLNPDPGASSEERDAAFEKAVDFATAVLEGTCRSVRNSILAEAEVLAAKANAGVVVLEKFVPWGEHIQKRPDQADLLYVVFPGERGGYMLQQIPKETGSFEGRKPLPEAWAGLRDLDLRELTGVADATFIHPGRFCGGAESLDGTLRLAQLAVEA